MRTLQHLMHFQILEFKQFNDELDLFRKEKFEDVVPEIKEVYEWAKN